MDKKEYFESTRDTWDILEAIYLDGLEGKETTLLFGDGTTIKAKCVSIGRSQYEQGKEIPGLVSLGFVDAKFVEDNE